MKKLLTLTMFLLLTSFSYGWMGDAWDYDGTSVYVTPYNFSNGKTVCLQDGTNCPGGSSDDNNYPTTLTVTNGSTHTITIGRNGLSALSAVFDDQTGGGNTSWNQSYANTLYYPLNTNPLGFYNVSTLPVVAQYSFWRFIMPTGFVSVNNNTGIRINAGTGITLTNDTLGNLTINSSVVDTNSGYTQWNVSNGSTVVSVLNGTRVNFTAGTGMSITQTGTDLLFACTVSGGGSGNVTGSGTVNYLSLWHNSTHLNSSSINETISTVSIPKNITVGTGSQQGNVFSANDNRLYVNASAVVLGNTADDGVVLVTNCDSSAPAYGVPNNYWGASCYDNGVSPVIRFRYNDSGTIKTGDVALV